MQDRERRSPVTMLGLSAVFVVAFGSIAPRVLADQGGSGGLPVAAPAVSEVAGGVRYEFDRLEANGQTLLVFKAGETGHSAADVPLAVQAQAMDQLLGRQTAARALPKHLEVRLGDTRYALISALQARLLSPGANWDPRLGRARSGASGPVIQTALSEVVDASPLPRVFAHHGYRLRLTDVARIEVGRPPSARGAKLPTEIDEMDFTADAER